MYCNVMIHMLIEQHEHSVKLLLLCSTEESETGLSVSK